MRKTTYTKSEYEVLKKLVSKKVLANRNEQKKIRASIRNIGFYFADFSSKKGYDISDLEELVSTNQIKISGGSPVPVQTNMVSEDAAVIPNEVQSSLEKESFSNQKFQAFNNLDQSTLSKTGLYFTRLKESSRLPDRYQSILDKRTHRIIYIGKAQGQSLRERLSQEIYHTRPGTFFRSIGAVLNYEPIPGHLKGKSNQNNYKFSSADTKSISDWLLKNTEFVIQEIVGDFSIEEKLIYEYCPLLNDKHNPQRLSELKEDRVKCREIARGAHTNKYN